MAAKWVDHWVASLEMNLVEMLVERRAVTLAP